MIDWILAERLAAYVAGQGSASAPTSDLAALAAESERRVRAYTGLLPVRPLPPPEGIGRREWIRTNITAMRTLLDPVLERAGTGLGPLKPAAQIALGFVVTTEVAVVLGYLAQRVLGQYELVLLDDTPESSPPRLLFVLPNLGQAVEAFGADEQEFMTWVALHEVTHAVQFSGVPWLHDHVAGLVREMLGKLLGMDMKMRQYEQGKIFCDAVVRERGVAALHHVFSGPEALPSLEEIRDPQAWLARTAPQELPRASGDV